MSRATVSACEFSGPNGIQKLFYRVGQIVFVARTLRDRADHPDRARPHAAQAVFRIHKDQLHVRPIWHHRAERVQGHILVCLLAFVLWKTLKMCQQRAGLGNSPRTLLEEFARIQSHDVILPTPAQGNMRLRCISQPDAAQVVLLERLGMVLPKRLRVSEIDLPAVISACARGAPCTKIVVPTFSVSR